jgi:hypothetical protein
MKKAGASSPFFPRFIIVRLSCLGRPASTSFCSLPLCPPSPPSFNGGTAEASPVSFRIPHPPRFSSDPRISPSLVRLTSLLLDNGRRLGYLPRSAQPRAPLEPAPARLPSSPHRRSPIFRLGYRSPLPLTAPQSRRRSAHQGHPLTPPPGLASPREAIERSTRCPRRMPSKRIGELLGGKSDDRSFEERTEGFGRSRVGRGTVEARGHLREAGAGKEAAGAGSCCGIEEKQVRFFPLAPPRSYRADALPTRRTAQRPTHRRFPPTLLDLPFPIPHAQEGNVYILSCPRPAHLQPEQRPQERDEEREAQRREAPPFYTEEADVIGGETTVERSEMTSEEEYQRALRSVLEDFGIEQ